MNTKNSYVISSENLLPRSNIIADCIRAFLVGGSICIVGQIIRDVFESIFQFDQDTVAMLVPVTMIFLGGLFTGLGIYDELGKFAGAGSVVPITGFANSVVSCAIEFKQEGYVLGVGANMFKIAGPVIVYGTVASVIYGVIYWVTTII